MPTATPTTATLTTASFVPVIQWGIIPTTLALVDTQYAPVIQSKIIVPVEELFISPKPPSVPGSYLKTGRLPVRTR
jgi:hypothetical protein